MPFATDTLPPEVEALPKEAQDIWLSVFNSTFRTFSGTEAEKEEASFIAAWGAVRSRFQKLPDGTWDRKAILSFDDAVGVKFQSVRFVKFMDDLLQAKDRITLGEVYVPWEVDAQGEFADEETIEKGAYNWMKKYQEIGEQHQLFGGKGVVVENFISRKGDRDFPTPGSWVMGTQWSEDMWEKILNGEVTGYSLGGKWTHVPIVAGREYAKSIAGRKSEEIGELDMDLFEKPQHAGPRVIWQIVSFDDIEEVSGVGMPAIRKPFKLFKGDRMKPKVRVVGKAKAAPAGPWLKLYQSFLDAGNTEEEARQLTEEALGPPPPGTFEQKQTEGVLSFGECVAAVDGAMGVGKGVPVCSLMQAKYAAGPEGGIALPEGVTLEEAAKEWMAFGEEAGILTLKEEEPEENGIIKAIKDGFSSIAKHLGVKGAEAQEEEPMTPQEKQEFDELKNSVKELTAALATKSASPAAECEGGKCGCQNAPAELKDEDQDKAKAAAPVAPVEELEPALLREHIDELAGVVKGLMDEIATMKSRPGVSVAEMVSVPNGKEFAGTKSAGGYEYSEMLSAPIPAGAREAVIAEATKRQSKLEERRAKSSRMNLRMG